MVKIRLKPKVGTTYFCEYCSKFNPTVLMPASIICGILEILS